MRKLKYILLQYFAIFHIESFEYKNSGKYFNEIFSLKGILLSQRFFFSSSKISP